MRWGARAVFLVALALLTTSCVKVTRLGGLVLWISADATLHPTALSIDVTSPDGMTTYDVTSPDGTKTYRDPTYEIPSQATLPTSLAIVSKGHLTASVRITATLSADGVSLVNGGLYQVPTDHVETVSLFFCDPKSGSCPSDAGAPGDEGAPRNQSPGDDAGTAAQTSPSAETQTGPSPETEASLASEEGGGAGPPDAGIVPMCAPNATQCSGNAAQTCIDGEWQTTTTCGDATPFCVAGACSSEPPSCLGGAAPGISDCGPTKESCCTSLEVEGGTFDRTYTSDPDGGAVAPTAPAEVSSFKLDKYDVTVGRFRQFVAAWNGGYRPAAGSGKHEYVNGGQGLINIGAGGGYEPGWATTDDSNVTPAQGSCGLTTWTSAPTTQENLPMNCVNWYEAYAFCIWDGGFLPSDAEFEYAAAGGNQQREYPWGDGDPGATNRFAIYGCYYGPTSSCDTIANIAPVGTAPLGAGRWGQNDLAGEVWEWNLDWADLDLPYGVSCSDCAQLTETTERVVRGSSFYSEPSSALASTSVDSDPPYERDGIYGFRCARAP